MYAWWRVSRARVLLRILKNSWGKGWGEQGFIRMSMGMDVCGVADVVTRPLV